jgi:indole-3-glycerol phosphate synthase
MNNITNDLGNLNQTILTTGTILDRIVEQKRFRLTQRERKLPLETLIAQVSALTTVPADFASVLRIPKRLSLIAEIKQASPSKGIIQPDFQPVSQAIAYAAANVQAISVLTEEDFFLGSDNDLRAIHAQVSTPLLRKDFTISAYQVYEARLLGASAILLIVAILSDRQLAELHQLARSLGLAVLVEVHNLDELLRAMSAGAEIIGINNRDLHTFHVDLSTTERLAGLIPQDKTIVAESGIENARDMARVYRAGAHAVLVGETLMRAAGSTESVTSKIKELLAQLPG